MSLWGLGFWLPRPAPRGSRSVWGRVWGLRAQGGVPEMRQLRPQGTWVGVAFGVTL